MNSLYFQTLGNRLIVSRYGYAPADKTEEFEIEKLAPAEIVARNSLPFLVLKETNGNVERVQTYPMGTWENAEKAKSYVNSIKPRFVVSL